MTSICIVSDTHDNVAAIHKATAVIRTLQPDVLVHCGDITSPSTLLEFGGFPLKLVYGNCDVDRRALLRQAHTIGVETISEEICFNAGGKSFYVCHGTDSRMVRKVAETGEYDFIFVGHSHEKGDNVLAMTRIINPGALYRAASYTIAHLKVETGVVDFIDIGK